MICRTCGDDVDTGRAAWVCTLTGAGYLYPATHRTTGHEAGCDGHTAAPWDPAPLAAA